MRHLKSSVHKTFALLDYFTQDHPEWGVTELARAMDTHKSTVYRFLADLSNIGVVHKNEATEKYRLGLKMFELGNRVNLKSAFVDKTHPILEEVARKITETVHIAIYKNDQVFYVDKVTSPQGLTISSQIGTYVDSYATGLGKVLLAHLPAEAQDLALQLIKTNVKSYTKNTLVDPTILKDELLKIKQKGYAIDREEYEIGLICVAIPIFNTSGNVVASLSASGPSSRFNEKEVENYVKTLKEGADAISLAIGDFKPTIV